MKHKIEIIDYLRGSSILMIILVHIILPVINMYTTDYSEIPHLFNLRDILETGIIIVVLCSGFSLYLSTKNLSFNFKNILHFYKKRLKRLILPWWVFCTIGLILFSVGHYMFKIQLQNASIKYILLSYTILPIGGIPAGWLILLMIVLSLLFPALKLIYEKKRQLIPLLILIYTFLMVIWIKNPMDINQYPNIEYSLVPTIVLILSSIFGWSLVYIFGFFLEELYNERKLAKKELRITFNFILLFLFTHIIYKFLGLDTRLYVNKFPPSPYYLSMGISFAFILLNMFFAYKKFIHIHLRRILSFFSYNSYWVFLWSLLILLPISLIFSKLAFINIYLKLALEFSMSCILVMLLVITQKKMIKTEMHLEKHHF